MFFNTLFNPEIWTYMEFILFTILCIIIIHDRTKGSGIDGLKVFGREINVYSASDPLIGYAWFVAFVTFGSIFLNAVNLTGAYLYGRVRDKEGKIKKKSFEELKQSGLQAFFIIIAQIYVTVIIILTLINNNKTNTINLFLVGIYILVCSILILFIIGALVKGQFKSSKSIDNESFGFNFGFGKKRKRRRRRR